MNTRTHTHTHPILQGGGRLSFNHSQLSTAELTPASPAHPGLTSAPRLCSEFVRAEIDVYIAHTERTRGGPSAWPEEEKREEEEGGYVSPCSGGITRHPLNQQRTVASLQETRRRGHVRACLTRGGDRAAPRCIAAQPTALPHAQTPVPPPGMLCLARGLPTAPGTQAHRWQQLHQEQLQDICPGSDRHGLRQSSRAHGVYFPPGARHTSCRPAPRSGLCSYKPAACRLPITLLV